MIIVRPSFSEFVDMGMIKTGSNFSIPAGQKLDVTNWSAHTSYPSTVITNHTMGAVGGGRVKITGFIGVVFFSSTLTTGYITVNGVEVHSFLLTSNNVTIPEAQIDVVPGDAIGFRVQNSQATVTTQITTSSYIHVTKV